MGEGCEQIETAGSVRPSAEPGEAAAYCFEDKLQIRTREPLRAAASE